MATFVSTGWLHLRPIQWWVSEVWCQETGSWSDRISVTLTILHQVAWSASPAVLQGFTDASSHGFWLPYAVGYLVSTAGKPAHQSARDGGCTSQCGWVTVSPQVLGNAPDVGQRCGHVVHQQGWWDQIIQADPPDDSALQVLRMEGHQASASSPSRILQHPDQRSVVIGTDPWDAVGHQRAASSSGVLRMGNNSDRSLHDFCQQEDACFCITIPGLEGQVHWLQWSVVWNGNHVCLPTIQDAANCLQQNLQVPQSW